MRQTIAILDQASPRGAAVRQWRRALLLVAMCGAGAFAQERPRGGSSMPSRSQSEDKRERSVEDGLLPDPWRAWRNGLEQARAALALSADQRAAFDAFLHELDDVQRLNTARVLRLVHGTRPVVDAVPDPDRDLRNELGDASDWADALKDLTQRWQALDAQLSAPQREHARQAYAQSRIQATRPAGPGGGPGCVAFSMPALLITAVKAGSP